MLLVNTAESGHFSHLCHHHSVSSHMFTHRDYDDNLLASLPMARESISFSGRRGLLEIKGRLRHSSAQNLQAAARALKGKAEAWGFQQLSP